MACGCKNKNKQQRVTVKTTPVKPKLTPAQKKSNFVKGNGENRDALISIDFIVKLFHYCPIFLNHKVDPIFF